LINQGHKILKMLLNYQVLLILKIMVTVNFYFYLEIFDKKSSSTLQKSIVVYSMPKANRFGNGPKYTG
jgi:hypothetical protein